LAGRAIRLTAARSFRCPRRLDSETGRDEVAFCWIAGGGRGREAVLILVRRTLAVEIFLMHRSDGDATRTVPSLIPRQSMADYRWLRFVVVLHRA
jgi:hypothetical protein